MAYIDSNRWPNSNNFGVVKRTQYSELPVISVCDKVIGVRQSLR